MYIIVRDTKVIAKFHLVELALEYKYRLERMNPKGKYVIDEIVICV